MTWAQDQRIAYIKERIEGGHRVTRAEVGARFNCTIQTVTATFHLFKARYPGLMAYDEKAKGYRRADLAATANLSWKERAEAAEAENNRLRDALAPFARMGDLVEDFDAFRGRRSSSEWASDFRRAAHALAPHTQPMDRANG